MPDDPPAKPDPDEVTPAEKAEAARRLREELKKELETKPKTD